MGIAVGWWSEEIGIGDGNPGSPEHGIKAGLHGVEVPADGGAVDGIGVIVDEVGFGPEKGVANAEELGRAEERGIREPVGSCAEINGVPGELIN